MPRSRRSTSMRAQMEDPNQEETIITEDLSSRMTRSKRALGDVSNKNSQDNGADDAVKHTTATATLRRSRRLSNGNPMPSNNNPEPILAAAAAAPRNNNNNNVSKKRGCNVEIQEMAKANAAAPSIQSKRQFPSQGRKGKGRRVSNINCKSESATTSSNIQQQQDDDDDDLDIEESLLEPKPKRKRKRERSTTARGKKKSSRKNEDLKIRVDPQTPEEVVSASSLLSSNSAIRLNPTNQCTDLLATEDDDYCLLRKVEGPFDASKYTTGIAIYDKDYKENVDEVPDYVTDIFQRLFDAEETSRPSPSYMTNKQNDINSTMRAILIDWLAVVHVKFRLMPETLYLAVNIIDRYLSRTRIHRRRLQLLGITALFVACKYEEIYPPECKDCVYITDRTYTRQDILDMEFNIVQVLEFKMTVPTAYPFLQRFLHITNAPKVVRDLASFYTERMLQEYCMLNFRGSLLACAAVCLAWNNPTVLGYFEEIDTSFPRVMEKLTNYTGFCEEQIKHTASVVSTKIHHGIEQRGSPSKILTGISSKYRCDRFSNASCCEIPQISHLNLP